jgi:hypothetical protein
VLFGLVFSRYEEIKNYTDGEWTTFILTIGEDGKAKASFEYPEELVKEYNDKKRIFAEFANNVRANCLVVALP